MPDNVNFQNRKKDTASVLYLEFVKTRIAMVSENVSQHMYILKQMTTNRQNTSYQ